MIYRPTSELINESLEVGRAWPFDEKWYDIA